MPAATLNYPALDIKGAGCICLLNANTTALQNENAFCVLNLHFLSCAGQGCGQSVLNISVECTVC